MSGRVPLQACRGREEVESLRTGMSDKKSTMEQLTPTTHQDVLIASSTIADFVAFRSTVDGSFFIRHLCQVFQDHAHEDTLQDMLLRVNDKVREMSYTTPASLYPSCCRSLITENLTTPALRNTTQL